MGHQPRRRRTRVAGGLLAALVIVGVVTGRMSPHGPLRQASASAATVAEPPAGVVLDERTDPVYAALNVERVQTGLRPLRLDAGLVASATSDACAIVHGDMPLSGDPGRLAASGATHENVGLVVDDDPLAGARAMHEWWAGVRAHRRDRMDPAMTRYGVGACGDEDRTYYVERFTP